MSEMKIDIRKAGAVIIEDRKLLVSRSFGKDIFIAPGGKLETGETGIDACIRELSEEHGILVRPEDLEFVDTFYAPAAGNETSMLAMEIYRVNKYEGVIEPKSEVEEIRWITSEDIDLKIGSIILHDVIPVLKKDNLID